MIPAPPHTPEYGDSGDLIGARRMRRSFRWGVGLIVVFTILLWVVEQFGRHAPAERLYLSALTLLPEQGRNHLREAVKVDAASESPSPRYLEALAEREEEDLVISAYERAYDLDPENTDLALKFGCQLIKSGLYTRARQLFRHAAESGTHNALAVYLEAAVLPLIDPDNSDIDGALALLERANASGDKVTFPQPMWFRTLPRDAYWYSELRRNMVRHCGHPIETLAEKILEATQIDLNENRTEIAQERLRALQTAGWRIASGAMPADPRQGLAGGVPQLYLGLHIMALAVDAQTKINQASNGADSGGNLHPLNSRLQSAVQQIEAFEIDRRELIQAEISKYRVPLTLVRDGLLVIFACYLLAYLISKLLISGSYAHNVRHPRISLIALSAGTVGIFAILSIIGMVQRSSEGVLPAARAFETFWWLFIIGGILAGLVSPALALPSVTTVLTRLPEHLRGDTRPLRKKYVAAYLSLVKRYLGLQFGLALVVVCTWVIAFRVFTSTYPWMDRLLITGMESQELDLIRSILASIG